LKDYLLKKSIREGKILCGISVSTAAPSLLEIMGYSGFDFTYIDLEHSAIDLESLTNMVVASELSGMGTLVRVSDNQATPISKALEIGADGVIVPHVNTREDAENAAQAARFPPSGKRGFGALVRASRYNLPSKPMEEYTRLSNEGVIVIAQIEEREALENIDQITETEGIDALLLGPSDLSLSLGVPGQFQSSEMIASINRVMETAKKKGVPIMCTASYLARPVTVESIRLWIDKGLRLVLFGSLEGLVRQACLNTMENFVNKIR
jgi:2-keto-3-deoxy-L-rhamnonate aldolase RhmA